MNRKGSMQNSSKKWIAHRDAGSGFEGSQEEIGGIPLNP
jgi:hypothetical protein